MEKNSLKLPGLKVRIDRLVHHHDPENLPPHSSHAFVYFITICNHSDRTVILLGRKWLIENEDGEKTVIEGDKIVGRCPTLKPGEEFSYNSYHVTGLNGRASGSFHGLDEYENRVHVKIPPFAMKIPESAS